jgi:DNA topoisomerase-2
MTGTVEKKDMYTIILKDLPPKHNLEGYKSLLKTLRDDQKVIKSFKDMSDKDILVFEVKVSGDFWNVYSTPSKLISLFDMEDKAKENFTYIHNNKVEYAKDVSDYFNIYFNYRLDAYISRKEAQLNKLQEDIEIADSKYRFIKAIVDGKILVNNKTKAEILTQIKQISPTLKLVDSNYDYLLRMPIYSVSKEKLAELAKEIEKIKADKINLEKTKVEDIWKQELKELEKMI